MDAAKLKLSVMLFVSQYFGLRWLILTISLYFDGLLSNIGRSEDIIMQLQPKVKLILRKVP